MATLEVHPDRFLEEYAEKGILIDSKIFYTDMDGKSFVDPKLFPSKKLLLKPDLSTIRNISWLKRKSVLIFSNVYDPETNEISEVSPRSILERKLGLFN